MTSSETIYIGIVDDDESVCRSMSRYLTAARLQTVTYPSAEAFLADTKHPRFDCLVFDIQLGGMSGLELGSQLAAAHDRTPIIFITAHDDPATKAQAEANGCCGYFRKTESGQEVIAAIRRAIGVRSPEAAVESPNENHPTQKSPFQSRR